VDARWVRQEELSLYHLTPMACAVIEEAFRFFKAGGKSALFTGRPFAPWKKTKNL
jgi:hypothetical protein